MDVNYFLIYKTIILGLFYLLFLYKKSYIPIWLQRILLWRRYDTKTNHPLVAKIEMSTKYLGYAYLITGSITIILFYLALNKYLYNGNIPECLLSLLDTFLSTSRKPLVSAESTILAIVMLSIHLWKRAYETYYVSVFSDRKMSILHCELIVSHYFFTILSLIGESEGFVRGSHKSFDLHKLTTMQLICVSIFLWSTYMQLRMNFILAGLRKNEHGDVVTKEYKIPVDELFNYITCPLQLMEILIYLMLSAILWQASTFHCNTFFVLMNQITDAFLSQQWYRKTFKNYPKERKILIPYIW